VRSRSWLSRNVIVLGVVSLFTDVSSEMIIPLLPVFLTSVLGAGALALGWIEGLAEATASVLKLLSGRWSDRAGRRRPFVIGGYTVSALARPLVALATAPWHVLAVRLADRAGKGLRSSPRDALLAASVAPDERASAFGLHRAMDHAGAVLGPLAATAVLTLWTDDLRKLFWLAAIPGALCVVVLVTGVREHPPAPATGMALRDDAPDAPGGLRRLLVPLGLFTLGNASDVFLLLKAGESRAPLVTLPMLWMALHAVKMATSLPAGWLADRHGRRLIVGVGWIVYAVIYTGFAFAESQATIWALFVAYGLYHGLTEGPEKALVAELVPKAQWGGAFGVYYLVLGLCTLAASVLFGALWQGYGSYVAFLTSAALALAAVACLAVLAPGGTPSGQRA